MSIDRRYQGSNSRLLGLSAMVIIMWGVTAWLREVAAALPPLELTGLAMSAAAASSALMPGARGVFVRAPRAHRWYAWLFIPGGLVGGAAFYFAALEYAPAAQVVVITYTWPLLFALASDVYNRRRPSVVTLFSLLVGLAGVVVMNGGLRMPAGHAWIGYAGGLLAGTSWVAYSLFLQVYERSVSSDFSAFFAAGAALATGLQIVVGGGLAFPGGWMTYAATMFLGIGPYGLGFVAWGYVVRHGNPRVIPVLPYAVPVAAAVTLVTAGDTRPTISLFAGCFLALSACLSALRPGARSGRAA